MTHKHKLKMLRVSGVLYEGKFTEVEIWRCLNCEKYMIIRLSDGKRITLENKLGEEI
ncbi:MAG: hypothetical protein ACTSWG_13160 [Candidatus Helarchaeota archaeon]